MGNWINIGGFIGTALGVVLSIYFYRRSIQRPVPTFAISPLRVRIVDRSKAVLSEIDILFNKRPLSDENVTATTVYFWNEGRLPLRRADVLKPYTISLGDGCEVLDSRVVKLSRTICSPQLQTTGSEVTMTFDVMEDVDALAIQIIHTGDPEGGIQMSGIAIGTTAPKRCDLTESGPSLIATAIYLAVAMAILSFGLTMFEERFSLRLIGYSALSAFTVILVFPIYRHFIFGRRTVGRLFRRFTLTP